MRLIDADALESDLKRQYDEVFGKAKKTVNPDDFFIERQSAYIAYVVEAEQNSFFEYLKARPTIDAEPVRHGRWSLDGECSECGEFDVRDPFGSAYCPHCGAKMKMEDESDG